jgi:hypothetical protein
MSPELISSRIARMVAGLAPKAKQPNSATVLNAWIAQAESKLGPEARGGRLGLAGSPLRLRSPRFSGRSTPMGDSCSCSRAARGYSTD